MPKEVFGLTEATHETLTDNVKVVAHAWDKSTRWVQRILSEDANDPFGPFLSLYAAIVKAGLSTQHYDAEMEFIRRRFERNLPPAAATLSFKSQLRSHNQTLERYVECMEDGHLEVHEIEDLERLMVKQLDAIKLSIQGLKLAKERLQNGATPLRVA